MQHENTRILQGCIFELLLKKMSLRWCVPRSWSPGHPSIWMHDQCSANANTWTHWGVLTIPLRVRALSLYSNSLWTTICLFLKTWDGHENNMFPLTLVERSMFLKYKHRVGLMGCLCTHCYRALIKRSNRTRGSDYQGIISGVPWSIQHQPWACTPLSLSVCVCVCVRVRVCQR